MTGYAAPRRVGPDTTGTVRVVIVDDSAEVRTLLRTQLRLSGTAVVEGEGGNGADAVDLARRLQPDAMLLDVSMPGMDGLEALPLVLECSPGTRVVMFSGFDEEPLALRALDLGATSYLTKTSSLEDVVNELVGGAVAPAAGEPAGETAGSRGDVADRAGPDEAGVDEGAGALEDQVERFQSVFDDAAIGMATMTLHGRIVRANSALCRILGKESDELLGVAYGAAVDDDRALADATTAIVDKGADVVTLEHPQVGDAYRRTTLTVVRDRAGQPLYLFAQCQDVTPQRIAELELRHSEQRFRLMVDAVREYAIFMLDTEGHVTSWNVGAERAKGWTAAEVIGKHFRLFYPREQQEARHPEHELDIAARDGVYQEEGWRVRKDGSRFWAFVTITKITDEDGRHIGFAKVTRDYTDRMQMLEQRAQYADAMAEANTRLEVANAELEAAAEEQSRFLAITAHELRSPVGVLSASGRMLGESWDRLEPAERDELLAGMQSSAAGLQRLLGDLLTTSRLHAATLDLDLVERDLAEALQPALRRLRVAHPDAVIESDLGAGVRAVIDTDRLAQIIDNLVANAVAHGRSPIHVAIRQVDDEAEVTVRDAGPGVPPELRDRLFERFATAGGGGHGNGLGLHIVRELTQALGGEASYLPDENAFVIRLPRASAEP